MSRGGAAVAAGCAAAFGREPGDLAGAHRLDDAETAVAARFGAESPTSSAARCGCHTTTRAAVRPGRTGIG